MILFPKVRKKPLDPLKDMAMRYFINWLLSRAQSFGFYAAVVVLSFLYCLMWANNMGEVISK